MNFYARKKLRKMMRNETALLIYLKTGRRLSGHLVNMNNIINSHPHPAGS